MGRSNMEWSNSIMCLCIIHNALRPQGIWRVIKHVALIFNYSWSRATCRIKKILFQAKVMNFRKLGLQLNYYTCANFNERFLIEFNRSIHLDIMHVTMLGI